MTAVGCCCLRVGRRIDVRLQGFNSAVNVAPVEFRHRLHGQNRFGSDGKKRKPVLARALHQADTGESVIAGPAGDLGDRLTLVRPRLNP